MEIATPAQVDAFIAREYPTVFAGGFRCTRMEPGRADARWAYDPSTLRPGGFISGPTQFTLADIALWCLSFTVLGLRPMAVTSDLAITFLKPAIGRDLLAEATLLRAGRTRLHGRVEIKVEGGDALVAHATGGYALLAEQ